MSEKPPEKVLCPKCDELLTLPWSEYDHADRFFVSCDKCHAELLVTAEVSVSFSAVVYQQENSDG